MALTNEVGRNNLKVIVRREGLSEIKSSEERRLDEIDCFECTYDVLMRKDKNDETARRTRHLTMVINGKDILACKFCGEYKARDSDCPLVLYDEASCECSGLSIKKSEKQEKYIIKKG